MPGESEKDPKSETYLSPLPIIFILAGEVRPVKSLQHLSDTMSGVSQHGSQWDPRSDIAPFVDIIRSIFQQTLHNHLVIGALCIGLLDSTGHLIAVRLPDISFHSPTGVQNISC